MGEVEPVLEGARGLLRGEFEEQLRRGDEEGGVPGEDGVVDDVLAIIVLPRPWAPTMTTLFPF